MGFLYLYLNVYNIIVIYSYNKYILIIKGKYILITKANQIHYSSVLFLVKKLYIFRTDLLSIIRSLNTVVTAIGLCHTGYFDCLLARSGWNSHFLTSLADSQRNHYDKYLLMCKQC